MYFEPSSTSISKVCRSFGAYDSDVLLRTSQGKEKGEKERREHHIPIKMHLKLLWKKRQEEGRARFCSVRSFLLGPLNVPFSLSPPSVYCISFLFQ